MQNRYSTDCRWPVIFVKTLGQRFKEYQHSSSRRRLRTVLPSSKTTYLRVVARGPSDVSISVIKWSWWASIASWRRAPASCTGIESCFQGLSVLGVASAIIPFPSACAKSCCRRIFQQPQFRTEDCLRSSTYQNTGPMSKLSELYRWTWAI